MNFTPGNIYHIYNRGNNRQKIFFNRDNYLFFLEKMRTVLLFHFDFIAYCLMPNHFHWLVRMKDTTEETRLTAPSGLTGLEARVKRTIVNDQANTEAVRKIANLQSSYSQAINKQNGTTGGLFQKKTKSKLLIDGHNSVAETRKIYHDDFFVCFNYIHQNPLAAGLVSNLENWEFSSFRDYAGLRAGTLCNQKLGRSLLRISSQKEFIKMSYAVISEELISKVF